MERDRRRRIVEAAKHHGTRASASRAGREAAHDVLVEHDLRGEQAASLGRAGRRIEAAIAEMEARAAAWRAEVDRREDHARAWAEARAAARLARWELVVQREAMGLTDHTALDRAYPIPPRPF